MANSFSTRVEENGGEGMIRLYVDGDSREAMGELFYVLKSENRLSINHTEVNPSLRGQGAGQQLVDRAVAEARKKEYRVIPLCPYARKVMHNHREKYQDVLD